MIKSEWKALLSLAIWGIVLYLMHLINKPMNIYSIILLLFCILLVFSSLIDNFVHPTFIDDGHTSLAFATPIGSDLALISSAILVFNLIIYYLV